MSKIIVVHHSADFDGLFCREIAHKFLPDAELIGWDFGDKPIDVPPKDTTLYVMDLPIDRPFGFTWDKENNSHRFFQGNLVWIDHHKSAIESHPKDIPGYRIDGVAACRLAWQWFVALGRLKQQGDIGFGLANYPFPKLEDFTERKVLEPLAVRLAGLYDVWDKRDPRAELFQHGLRSRPLTDFDWKDMLSTRRPSIEELEGLIQAGHSQNLLEPDGTVILPVVHGLLEGGKVLQYARAQEYAEVIQSQGFDMEFEGLKFLACCSHELDIRSHLFEAGVKPHHDALCGFTFNGTKWRVSLYHAPGKEQHDLSLIATKHGGGGHRGAAGFVTDKLPWLP